MFRKTVTAIAVATGTMFSASMAELHAQALTIDV